MKKSSAVDHVFSCECRDEPSFFMFELRSMVLSNSLSDLVKVNELPSVAKFITSLLCVECPYIPNPQEGTSTWFGMTRLGYIVQLPSWC